MSRKWLRKTGLIGTFVLPAAVVAVVLIQIVGVSSAIEPEPAPDPVADSAPVPHSAPPTASWQHRDFFKPFPPGQSHQKYPDMNGDEQAMVDDAKAHYDTNVEEIAQAYRGGTLARAQAASLQRAELTAGLDNTADVGVE